MKIKRTAGIAFIVAMMMSFTFNSNLLAQEEGEHGEESGKMYSKTQIYEMVKSGVKLTLKYDKAASAFLGIMENVSKMTAESARVEVHLSNGVELGPTKPGNLKAGEKVKVKLNAKGQKFETWNCHAEVGKDEHGGEERGEHGREGREGKGEHGGKEVKEKKSEHSKKEGRGEHIVLPFLQPLGSIIKCICF